MIVGSKTVTASVGLGVCVLAALGAAPAPAITVRGDSRCPTAPEVAAALAGLLPAGSATSAERDVVEVSGQHGLSPSVRLSNAKNQMLAEKRLPETLSCAERARAAAVIVAAWEARFAATPPVDVAAPVAPAPFVAPRPAPVAASVVQTQPTAPPPPAIEAGLRSGRLTSRQPTSTATANLIWQSPTRSRSAS